MSRKEKRLNEKPWITRGILTSIKTKNRLFKNYYKSNSSDSFKKQQYKKYLNKLTHIKNIAKCSYYKSLIPVKKNKRNPSQTWSIIKDIIDFKNSTNKAKLPSTIMIRDEKIKTDSKKFLNIACEYFANLGTNMSKKLPFSNSSSFKIYSKSCMKSFLLEEITLEEINFYIDNLKSNSSLGIDDLPPKFIKLAKCILSPHLVILFNKCIKQEIFPNDFKLAYVRPIPKTLSPKSLNDLCPISLLSVFAKLFEKILENKMSSFLIKNKLLSPCQYGFKKNNSTELAITSFYDKLLNNINENKITCSIFLDLRKAFDSVNHQILLKKLYHYGFRDKIFNFLKSYLADRKICTGTKLDGKVSSTCSVQYGVPQGSILGPLLFLLYVNDLPYASNFETTPFADDTNLHIFHHDIHVLQSHIKQEVNKISN